MQSTGHTSVQLASLAPMHGSLITYVTRDPFSQPSFFQSWWRKASRRPGILIVGLCKTQPVLDLPGVPIPGDALSQPTRARLFALLGEMRRPIGTAELAERLDLHPNGVRIHL